MAFGDYLTVSCGLGLPTLKVFRRILGAGLLILSAATAFQGIKLAGASLEMGNLLDRDPRVHDTHIVLTHAGFTLIGWQIVAATIVLFIAALFSGVLGLRLLLPSK